MTLTLTQAQQDKILTPPVLRLMSVLSAAGAEARVVGGAVRDAILNRPVGDIDFAANIPPEQLIEILTKANIKTVPTGLAHGTITAVIDRVGYEITTLRHDVATDGRHAQVAFTDDWQSDAARRDFTFNALYLDAHGQLYDYFNGAEDAAAGRVKFIGDAATRIREDVLRILRFFRFTAWFGRGEPDAPALTACRELVNLIPTLSAERVAREVLKLLAAPNPLPAWELMRIIGALSYVVPSAVDFPRLRNLLITETQMHEPPSGLLRLAALLPQEEPVAIETAARLKLSTRDRDQLITLATLPSLVRDQTTTAALRRILYRYGCENTRAALLLNNVTLVETYDALTAWENPVFPIKGEDIVKTGIPAGPRIGQILRATEEWWIDGDFRASRTACLAFAADNGKNH